MGRDDSLHDKTYYGAREISYPDFVVCRDSIVFSIELKTPREGTFKAYLSNHFYTEKVFAKGRSVVEEIDIRRGLTDGSVEICLLFDVRNLHSDDSVITDLKNSITLNAQRRSWWERNINGVLFYKKNLQLTKRFTIQEILSQQSIHNAQQQTNLASFFTVTNSAPAGDQAHHGGPAHRGGTGHRGGLAQRGGTGHRGGLAQRGGASPRGGTARGRGNGRGR